jgi:beta-galactosidase
MKKIDAKKLSSPAEGTYSYGGYYDMPEDKPMREMLINDGWLFAPTELAGAEFMDYDVTDWKPVDLPHDFSLIPLPGGDNDEQIGPFSKLSPGRNATGHVMGGTGWYRKIIKTDKNMAGKLVKLKFDGTYNETKVWVNGIMVGNHVNGYAPYYYDITNALKPLGEENIIAVRCRNNGRNAHWYSGAGIYRDVKLEMFDPVHVDPWGAYVTLSYMDAYETKVNVETRVVNETDETETVTVQVVIRSMKGRNVGNAHQDIEVRANSWVRLTQMMHVSRAVIWSLENPYLYTAEITLRKGDKVIDEYKQKFGVRKIEVSADKGFRLNGELLKLKGGCVHHDNGLLGSAAFKRAEYRKVELLKEAGYNAVRTTHNPPSTHFLDACDELGILVIEEFTDVWEVHKTPQDYATYFKETWEPDLTNMIKRDRNHPSVFMWSIGNEIPNESDEEALRIQGELIKRVKELDATRFVTQVISPHMVAGGRKHAQLQMQNLDICGYNNMSDRIESDHEAYPDRIFFTAASYSSKAYDYWKQVTDKLYVIGDFVWTAMDYLGEVSAGEAFYAAKADVDTGAQDVLEFGKLPDGIRPEMLYDIQFERMPNLFPKYISWCGDLDITGRKKPQGYYRNVLWDVTPVEMLVHEPVPDGMVENMTPWGWPNEFHHWNWLGNEGKPMKVRVFTKGDKVKLTLHGMTIAEADVNERYIAEFEVPFDPGRLEAIAYKAGNVIGKAVLRTASDPHGIELRADKVLLEANREDLSYIQVKVIDRGGNKVTGVDVPVEVTVMGNGELLGCGNGSIDGMKSFNHATFKTWRAYGQIIVRPFAKPGDIYVKVKSQFGETMQKLTVLTIDH